MPLESEWQDGGGENENDCEIGRGCGERGICGIVVTMMAKKEAMSHRNQSRLNTSCTKYGSSHPLCVSTCNTCTLAFLALVYLEHRQTTLYV